MELQYTTLTITMFSLQIHLPVTTDTGTYFDYMAYIIT